MLQVFTKGKLKSTHTYLPTLLWEVLCGNAHTPIFILL